VRGKGTKLSEGCPKVRLSQDRMAIFGIVTLLYGSIRDFYVREKFVAPTPLYFACWRNGKSVR
jgi:hypothetical protein